MRLPGWHAAITDESAQNRDDGGLVAGGILHQALERVDATKPDID